MGGSGSRNERIAKGVSGIARVQRDILGISPGRDRLQQRVYADARTISLKSNWAIRRGLKIKGGAKLSQRSGCGTIAAILLLVSFIAGLVGSYRLDADVGVRRERGGLMAMSMRICESTHPMETWSVVRGVEAWKTGTTYNTPQRHVCEKQHVIQQGGLLCAGDLRSKECDWRTVYWPRTLHQYTDSIGERVYQKDSTFDRGITSDNHYDLEAAYKMGAYGVPWSVMFVDYKDKQGLTTDERGYTGGRTHFVSLNMDGVSNLVYFWTWIVNIPQKYANLAVHIFNYNDPKLWVDFFVSFLWTVLIDLPLATASTLVGLVGGTVLNPVDTLFAIPGGAYLFFEAIWTGGVEFARAVPRLRTA